MLLAPEPRLCYTKSAITKTVASSSFCIPF
nr:MAG TPA: hypothetical protein [Caudoviricetes sp.]